MDEGTECVVQDDNDIDQECDHFIKDLDLFLFFLRTFILAFSLGRLFCFFSLLKFKYPLLPLGNSF